MTELGDAGAILTGLAAVITGGVVWYRNNRIANSKANADIASNFADEAAHSGQADEILDMRKRISELDSAFVSQAAEQGRLKQKVSSLEAMMIGISQHHDNLLLCDACKLSNSRVLAALSRTLKAAGIATEEVLHAGTDHVDP